MKTVKKTRAKAVKKASRKDVVASRRACDVKGTGLSHYILMDRKGKQE